MENTLGLGYRSERRIYVYESWYTPSVMVYQDGAAATDYNFHENPFRVIRVNLSLVNSQILNWQNPLRSTFIQALKLFPSSLPLTQSSSRSSSSIRYILLFFFFIFPYNVRERVIQRPPSVILTDGSQIHGLKYNAGITKPPPKSTKTYNLCTGIVTKIYIVRKAASAKKRKWYNDRLSYYILIVFTISFRKN